MSSFSSARSEFASTRWSLIASANEKSPNRREALASLCEIYWLPVYAFVRRRGYQPDDARDLTQELFTGILCRDGFELADPSKGRFRSYLMGAVKNLLAEQTRNRRTQKRGGDVKTWSFDWGTAEERLQWEPSDIRFDDVVLRTLEKEPTRRYQHVTEVQTAVEKIAAEPSVSLPSIAKGINALKMIPAHGVLAAAVLDALVGVFNLWAFVFFRVSRDESFFIGSYHMILAIVLWIGSRHMLNQGSPYWRTIAALISVLPIHCGAIAGWFFCSLRVFSRLTNSKKDSNPSSHSPRFMDWEKNVPLVQGQATKAITCIANGCRSIFHAITSAWKVAWRKILRAVSLMLLWSLFCIGTSLGTYWTYGRLHMPTTVHIGDSTASTTALSTSDDIRMSIISENVSHRTGYDLQPAGLKRQRIECSLYRAADKPASDTRSSHPYAFPRRVYSSEAFFAYFTPSNTVEYQIQFPQNFSGTVVEPSEFMQKLIDTLPRVSANAMYDRISRPRSNNFLQFAIDDFQHRPMLNDPKPIEEWLDKSGMTAEEARQTAVGLYALLADLASTGGMITDDSGRTRLIPIANMLDREIFDTQGSDRIAIDVITQAWAIQLWIGSTIAACLAGIFAIPYLMFRRANAKL